ncbi:MAG: hypothetical protein ISS95_01095 [Candidatus Aenigmarchaeota archaeon]|nr:hypothetical protein [Candidatus Aenigmarchaeota archaeon]
MARKYIPVEVVQKLSGEGRSEAEITSFLSSQGFSEGEIDKALKIAIKAGVEEELEGEEEPEEIEDAERMEGPPERPTVTAEARETGISRRPSEEMQAEEYEDTNNMRDEEHSPPISENMREGGTAAPISDEEKTELPAGLAPITPIPSREEVPLATEEGAPYEEDSETSGTAEEAGLSSGEITIEEIVESVIAEKWLDFEKRLGDFEQRDMKHDRQIQEIEKKIGNFVKEGGKSEKDIANEIEVLSDSIMDMQTKVNALEKSFKGLAEHFENK